MYIETPHSYARILSEQISMTPVNKNIRLLIDGQEALEAIETCIRQAKWSIRIRMFMWKDDRKGRYLLALLQQKIKTTPSIKIIIEKDAFGSRVYNMMRWFSLGRKPGDIFSSKEGEIFLKQHTNNVHFISVGSSSLLFFKLLKENDHSKVYIFDEGTPESITLIGGMNIGDEYLTAVNHQHPEQGGWHDYMVRIKGEGANNLLPPLTIPQKKYWFRKKIMNGIEILFNWKGKRKMKRELIKELRQAKKSIIIEHGYITDDSIIRTLRRRAKKNVHVAVILPDRSDGVYHANMHTIHKLLKPISQKRSVPFPLHVFLYKGMIHAKVIVIDETTTIMGSANLTPNSFHFLNETNAIFRSKTGITKEVLRQIKKDLLYCTPITVQTIPPYNRFRAVIEKMFI